jgi:molybdopterin-guanine dinucleotide biosynthesis protein A
MALQTKVTGVILAGGRAQRMNFQNKGLQLFRGKSLISYSFNALRPVVDELLINANRDLDEFKKFGVPVISDLVQDFSGALAGILAAMTFTDADLLIVVPCDAPFISTSTLQHLFNEHKKNDAEITVACTGEQIHSVFLVLNTNLQSSLENYLVKGNHKVRLWFELHNTHVVDFGENTIEFVNINTLDELTS